MALATTMKRNFDWTHYPECATHMGNIHRCRFINCKTKTKLQLYSIRTPQMNAQKKLVSLSAKCNVPYGKLDDIIRIVLRLTYFERLFVVHSVQTFWTSTLLYLFFSSLVAVIWIVLVHTTIVVAYDAIFCIPYSCCACLTLSVARTYIKFKFCTNYLYEFLTSPNKIWYALAMACRDFWSTRTHIGTLALAHFAGIWSKACYYYY